MRNMSLSVVLHRSTSGQALIWGTRETPSLHERLLLRLNGYTPLGELLAQSESEDQILDAADLLVERGLADVIEAEHPSLRTPSGWMDLPANG